MSVRIFKEEDKELQNRYVAESSMSTCYHQIAWKDVIEKSFGHDTFYLLFEQERGKINGILRLVELKSLLFGNFMVSLPYFNYGGK